MKLINRILINLSVVMFFAVNLIGCVGDGDSFSKDEFRLSSLTIDSGADGSQNIIENFTYDENGNLLTKSVNSDTNRNPSRIESFTYDESGNLLTESVDSDSDGSPNYIVSYTYNENGKIITESKDHLGLNNQISSTNYTYYTYDDNGYLISKNDSFTVLTYTNDERGNVLSVIADEDGFYGGDILNSCMYKYYANRNLLSEECTDQIGAIKSITYDINGKKTKQINSFEGDSGTYTYTYDTEGKLLLVEGIDGESGLDSQESYNYDEYGNLLNVNYNSSIPFSGENYIKTYLWIKI